MSDYPPIYSKQLRCAVYLRVSSRDDRQTTENQWRQLIGHVEEQRWIMLKQYEDHDSGGNPDRPGFKEMMEDARKRKFDVVVFWALDRFSREGVFKTLTYLNMLSQYGVAYSSFQERYLDTCGIFKDAVISILATIAQQERIRQSERVRAGLERAKARGQQLGRHRLEVRVDMEHFRKAIEVYNVQELITIFKISRAAVYRLRAEIRAEQTRAELGRMGENLEPAAPRTTIRNPGDSFPINS